MRQKLSWIAALLCIAALAVTAAERNTPRIETAACALTAGETVWTGLVIGQLNGYAYRYVSGSTNLTVVGLAQNSVASNGTVRARSGIYGLANDGTVTAAHIGKSAYASTNNTAYTVSASGSAAVGKIVALDGTYVWVRLGN